MAETPTDIEELRDPEATLIQDLLAYIDRLEVTPASAPPPPAKCAQCCASDHEGPCQPRGAL